MAGKPLRASALLALVAVTLTACGGGGGSSPAPAAQSPPPPAPSGPSLPEPLAPINPPSYPSLELTATNAPEAAALALRALGEAPPLATFAVFIVELQMRTGPTSFGPCAGFPPGASTVVHFDVDANGAISRGDILTAEFLPCTGSAGTMVIRPTLVDIAAQRLEARVEFTTESASGDGVQGRFDLVTTFAGAPRVQTLSDFGIVVRENGETTYVTGGRIEVAATVAPQYSFGYAGTVSSGRLERSYRLTTPVALLGHYSAPPSEGAIVVEGSPARVRIAPATDPAEREDMASLAVDAAGSGQYGAATPLPWARLLRIGNLFRWHPNTRPRVTRLEITPANPNRLDTLVPSYDAFDHDGDTLHLFEIWSINGVRLPQPSPTLPPGSFVRGDEIELMLQAQDNAGGVGRRSITFTIGNAPPIATAAITPTAPLSIQDLALSSTASDPDGDALTTNYAWRVDGDALAGQIGASLSHTAHAKNDVVTGVVAVNDGFTTTTAEASVTILDTPGTVAVPSPPTGVDYDDLISFTAEASDYDGDDTSTKDFRLVYGPAGMTVHPDTGVVRWTAGGPMFEPTLRVSYGVTLDEPGAGVATGSFVVTDPSHVPPLARGALGPPNHGGLHVTDLDGDGDLETLIATSGGIYELQKSAGPGFSQTWADFMAPGGIDAITGIAAEDLDGDNRAEIFAAYYNCTIVQYSGVDRSLTHRAEVPVPPGYICRDFAVADLDGDGASEVICLAVDTNATNIDAPGVILVLAADTLDVVAQLAPDIYQGYLAVANVDNDAALEIVTGSGHVFDGVATLASSSLPQWEYAPGFGWPIAAGDVDGDGVAEIIGIEGVEPIAGLSGTVTAFDARTQTQRWSFASPNPWALHVADVAGDSSAEILVGHGLIGDVTAYRQTGPTTTSELFTVELGDNASIHVIATGNLDADADIEIITGGGSAEFAIAGGSPTPQIEWVLGDGGTIEDAWGFIGGERHGAELVFLVAGSDGNQHFARFDTAAGDIAVSGELGTYGDFDAAFAVVDYDDDGVREALLATEDVNNVETRVLAYDLSADVIEWSASGGISESGPADVAYGDFTGDGRDELVVLTEGSGLRVYDVAGDALLYERPGAFTGASDVAVANLDGAGLPEIVATMDNRLVVFSRNATGFVITETSAGFGSLAAVEVTDIDGDGMMTDIFLLYGTLSGSTRLARLDASLQLRGDVLLGQAATDMTTERSSFARKNLVFWNSTFMSELFAADPIAGAVIWRAPRFFGFIPPDSVRYHDVAGNGDWSISVGAGAGITLTR